MKDITRVKKRYWHELTDKEIQEFTDRKVTWDEIMNTFKQPDWCSYPNALNGILGCWSLTDEFDLRHQISRTYCKNCDCYIKKERK